MKRLPKNSLLAPAFAALFDMDGLMVDTETIQSEGYRIVMEQRYNLVPDITEHGTVHVPGEKTVDTWQRLMNSHSFSGDVNELTAHKRQAVMEVLNSDIQPLPGLVDLFLILRENGIPIAVGTSAQRERAELILKKLGLEKDVDALITASDVDEVKPAPDIYEAAAKALGVGPKNCIVFEDAEVGVLAGKRAGAKVVAVPNKFTQRMDFSRADLVVNSLAEVTFANLIRLRSNTL